MSSNAGRKRPLLSREHMHQVEASRADKQDDCHVRQGHEHLSNLKGRNWRSCANTNATAIDQTIRSRMRRGWPAHRLLNPPQFARA